MPIEPRQLRDGELSSHMITKPLGSPEIMNPCSMGAKFPSSKVFQALGVCSGREKITISGFFVVVEA
jgi:hypothetical protein